MTKLFFIVLLLLSASGITVNAAETTLNVTIDGNSQSYTAAALLRRSDATTITIERDAAYQRAMTYRAIPLAAILKQANTHDGLFLEVKALDGFVSQLPNTMVLNKDSSKAVAMLAIEDSANPWPVLPGKSRSAGPFYLVWVGAGAAAVRGEQWPYQVGSLTEAQAPEKRWPQLAVNSSFEENDPRRQGQNLFVVQCLVCHKLDGGGNSAVGPDLNHPMNPTEYFTLPALKKYLRDPAAVRDWPERKMPAFDSHALSDSDIDQIIEYLRYKAAREKVDR